MIEKKFSITPIGFVKSPYKENFVIPRQSGLVKKSLIHIEMDSKFTEYSIRGLADFELIWVHFIFHQSINEGWAELVRPPRLGGNKKVGVFASRSPHRPNFLGLSLLKLEEIIINKNIKIICSGADLLDKTPVVDIKPYVFFSESKKPKKTGYITGVPEQLKVIWENNCYSIIDDQNIKELIEESISYDPRPAFHKDENRLYFSKIDQYEIQFQIKSNQVFIKQVYLI